jgi:Skp family chaperone for outer membrane proteins
VFFAEDRKALDILCARKDVDANRIGCGGLSGGGMRTVFMGGLDERIKCAVCVGFMTTWKDFVLNKSYTHTWMTYVPILPNELDFPEIFGLRASLPALVLNDEDDQLYTLPEMKQADSELKGFQSQLQKKGQEMVQALQDKAAEIKRKEEQGAISPKDLETQNAKLAEDQQAISNYEQEVYAKLAQKREELFSPILEKVNKAMADVAKENGYLFVFDTNSNIVLYAHESLDVTQLVKVKLSIP